MFKIPACGTNVDGQEEYGNRIIHTDLQKQFIIIINCSLVNDLWKKVYSRKAKACFNVMYELHLLPEIQTSSRLFYLQVTVSLLNMTQSHPNLTVVLNVNSATEIDTGRYQCKTDPPHAISPPIQVTVIGKTLVNTTVLSTINTFHYVSFITSLVCPILTERT